jgi:hypothetical protein
MNDLPSFLQFISWSKLIATIMTLALSAFSFWQKAGGALTPINQNAIKKGKCGNLECGQTERVKSERDKAHISVGADFAQTDFAQTELAKTMFCKSGIP